MSNRTEARSAKAARTHATGRLPLLRLFSTPLIDQFLTPHGPHGRRMMIHLAMVHKKRWVE
jgi:hypothetical protein